MNVNNGKRIFLEVPDFVGLAGLVETGGVTTLAYRPNRHGKKLGPGDKIEVEGAERMVATVTPSAYVDKMILVKLI